MANILFNVADLTSSPLTVKFVELTPTVSPQTSGSFIYTSDAVKKPFSGGYAEFDNVLAGLYDVEIIGPEADTKFQIFLPSTASGLLNAKDLITTAPPTNPVTFDFTSSWAISALTASYVPGISNFISSSYSLTSSYSVTSSYNVSSSYAPDTHWTSDSFGGEANTTDHVFIKHAGVVQYDGNNNALLDTSGVGSVLFNIRALDDHTSVSAVDWDNRELVNSNGVSVATWANGLTASLFGTSSVAKTSVSANTASYINAFNIDGTVANANHAIAADDALFADAAISTSYATFAQTFPAVLVTGSLYRITSSFAVTTSYFSLPSQISLTGLTSSTAVISSAYQFNSSPTNLYVNSFTASNVDDGKLLIINSGSVVKVWLTGSVNNTFSTMLYQSGSGAILFQTAAGVTYRNRSSSTGSAGQYSFVSVIRLPNGDFGISGDTN